MLWVVFWVFLGADRPGTHKFISKAEQAYIETNLGSKVSTDTVRGNSHLRNTSKASITTICQDLPKITMKYMIKSFIYQYVKLQAFRETRSNKISLWDVIIL
jgi:hypothetical protein